MVRGKREGRERKRFEYPSDKECGPTIQIDKMYASTCFFFSLFFIVSKLLYLFLPSLFYVLDSTWWKGDTLLRESRTRLEEDSFQLYSADDYSAIRPGYGMEYEIVMSSFIYEL